MKNPRRLPGGAATGTQGTGVRSHPASARYSKNLAARAELNQIPSGFFNPQPLGSPLGGSLIMRSGHCWRATCRCANNARSCSSRGGKLSGQPFLTIGGGGAFPFPLPRPAQPETLTATRVATKAHNTFFIGGPLSSRPAMHFVPRPTVGRAARIKGSMAPEIGPPRAPSSGHTSRLVTKSSRWLITGGFFFFLFLLRTVSLGTQSGSLLVASVLTQARKYARSVPLLERTRRPCGGATGH
jgi:hypothetical protein